MTTRNRLVALGAAGLIGAAALALPAVAQDADPPAGDQEVTDEETADERAAEKGERFQELLDRVAAELGIPSEELEAAVDAVAEDLHAERLAELAVRLDEAVAGGDLARERADEILERAETREPGDGLRGLLGHHRDHHRLGDHHHGRRGFGGRGPGHGPRDEAPADDATADDVPADDAVVEGTSA